MSRYTIEGDTLTDIADAIRAIAGGESLMTPAQMTARLLATRAIADNFAPEYDDAATYAVGDYCMHENSLHCCSTAIPTAEAWNAAHWTEVSFAGEVGDLKTAMSDVESFINTSETVDLMEESSVGMKRITASSGDTADNSNWKSFLVDIDQIGEEFSAKLYSSSSAYAVGAFYSSKTDLSSRTLVGNVIASSSNAYTEINNLNIPSGAVCVLFAYRTTGTESYIRTRLSVANIYKKSEVDTLLDETRKLSESVPIAYNIDQTTDVSGGGYKVESGIAVLHGNAEGWRYKVYTVSEGQRYYITSSVYGSEYHAVILTDSDLNVVEAFEKHDSNTYKVVEVELVVPSGVSKMIVNNKEEGVNTNVLPSNFKVKKEPIRGIGGKLTVLTANGNSFPVGTSSFPETESTYRTRWRNLINDSEIDFMAITEYGDGSFGTDTVENALFGDGVEFFQYFYSGVGIANACRLIGAHLINKLSITGSIIDSGGVEQTTFDHFVMKTEIDVNGTPVIMYSVKLCASGADPTPEKLAWTKALRQLQYQDILDDISKYGYAHYIILGDFNAQNCAEDNEYQIFLDAGLTICNGGYTGWHSTLRNINADNIIFSPTIKLVSFKVLNSYSLNSDHYPIMAELQINPVLA